MRWYHRPSMLVSVVWLSIHPLPRAQQWWGMVSIVVTILILLGLIGAGIGGAFAPSPLPEPSPRWPLVVAYPSLVGFVLILIAAVRLSYRLALIVGPSVEPGDIVKGRDFHLSDFFLAHRNHRVDNATFERCILRGPCPVMLIGNNKMIGTTFFGANSDIDSIIIEVPEEQTLVGAGAFVHCKFNYCRWEDVSFLMTPAQAARFRQDLKVRF